MSVALLNTAARSLFNPKALASYDSSFFVSSGTITFNPASSAGAFTALLVSEAPPLIVNPTTGAIILSDLALPAAPGHYNLDGFGPFAELQIQVTQLS